MKITMESLQNKIKEIIEKKERPNEDGGIEMYLDYRDTLSDFTLYDIMTADNPRETFNELIGDWTVDGAVYYGELKDEDKSIEFLDEITDWLEDIVEEKKDEIEENQFTGLDEVKQIAKDYEIEDINKIKPGVGETTRLLLRRYPDRVLINMRDINDPDLDCVIQVCKEKNVPIERYPLERYKVVGIIKDVSDL